MTETAVDVVSDGFEFCEAPCADENGAILFSDLTGGGYYRCRLGEKPEIVLPERMWIGGAIRDVGDALLSGGKGGLVLLQDGAVRRILWRLR